MGQLPPKKGKDKLPLFCVNGKQKIPYMPPSPYNFSLFSFRSLCETYLIRTVHINFLESVSSPYKFCACKYLNMMCHFFPRFAVSSVTCLRGQP